MNPPFAALVARLPRVRFIAITYRFFIVNLLIFIFLFKVATADQHIWVGRIFFHLDIDFQSVRCFRLLGTDGRCLQREQGSVLFRIHCRRRNARGHCGVEYHSLPGKGCVGNLSTVRVGGAFFRWYSACEDCRVYPMLCIIAPQRRAIKR